MIEQELPFPRVDARHQPRDCSAEVWDAIVFLRKRGWRVAPSRLGTGGWAFIHRVREPRARSEEFSLTSFALLKLAARERQACETTSTIV